ncbi:MAG TPA: asparaginase [Nocardioidaceae bacterium]|nr:asparaginase [Nocardioidaceae bacterium]
MPESPRPRVAVGTLGGTITMTSPGQRPHTLPNRTAGVIPSAGATDLLAAVPGLRDVAEVRGHTLRRVPGASLRFEDLLECLAWAREAVDDGATGVVLVQGTDTLEESAYLLDLFWDRPHPLVLTGAMRNPEQVSADGPGNLLAAVITAGSRAMRDSGVLVVMNDEVHAAVRVRKSDPTALDAFRSPSGGPIGRVVEGTVVPASRIDRVPPLPTPSTVGETRVALVECAFDDRGELLRVAADRYDGIVVAAFGAGHVSEPAAEVVSEALARVAVVVASRTGAGTTLSGTYGFTGSESDLLRRGAVLAGWLDPRKSRLLLWALLALGLGQEEVRAEFARRGRASGSVPV